MIRNFTGHTSRIYSVAFGKGNILASGSLTIKIWNSTNGALIQTLFSTNLDVRSLTFGEGNLLYSGLSNGTIRIFDWSNGYLIENLEHLRFNVVFGEDNILASGSSDGVGLWNWSNRTLIRTLTGDRLLVFSVAFLKGNFIASGSLDCKIQIWDYTNGRLIRTLEGHNQSVSSLAFGKGNLLISGSWIGNIRLWDLSDIID